MLYSTEINIGTFTEILVSEHSWLDKREEHWIRLEYHYSLRNDFLVEFFWTGSQIKKVETRHSQLEDGFGNPEIAIQFVYDIQFLDKDKEEDN